MIKFDRANARIRPMAAEDKCLVLSWRNVDRVRQHMNTTHIITKAEHDAWYANVLNSDDKKYLNFQLKDRPFGVISFSEINQSDETAFWAFYLGEADAPVGGGTDHVISSLRVCFSRIELV